MGSFYLKNELQLGRIEITAFPAAAPGSACLAGAAGRVSSQAKKDEQVKLPKQKNRSDKLSRRGRPIVFSFWRENRTKFEKKHEKQFFGAKPESTAENCRIPKFFDLSATDFGVKTKSFSVSERCSKSWAKNFVNLALKNHRGLSTATKNVLPFMHRQVTAANMYKEDQNFNLCSSSHDIRDKL